MNTITFDTLKFVQTLEHSGVDPKQAEAFAEAHRDSLKQLVEEQKESVKSELSAMRAQTQSDLKGVSTQSDVEKIRTEMAEMRADTKSEFAHLRSEMRFVKWMIGLVLGLNGIVLSALIALLLNLFAKA